MASKSKPAPEPQQRHGADGAARESTTADGTARPAAGLLGPQDLLGLQRAVGNQAVQRLLRARSPALQRFPVVEEARGAAHRIRGGTSMTAKVGGESEWVYGGRPPGGVPNLMTKVGAYIQGTFRYIAGHLLNDNMGGGGTNDNLTVLSSDANKAHRGIEGKVKSLAVKADQINAGSNAHGDPAYDHGARYSVDVLDPAPGAVFPFSSKEQYIGAGLQISIIPIRIHKGTGVESPWPEETGGSNHLVNHVVPNVPPYPDLPAVQKPSKLISLVIDAIRTFGSAASAQDILNQIHVTDPLRTKRAVDAAIAKALSLRFLSKRSNKYKVIEKNVT